MPLLVIEQVGGFTDNSAPVENPRLSFSCWSTKKETASDLRRALVAYLKTLDGVMLDPQTRCGGVTDITSLFIRERDSAYCRYIVDATVTTA